MYYQIAAEVVMEYLKDINHVWWEYDLLAGISLFKDMETKGNSGFENSFHLLGQYVAFTISCQLPDLW